MKRILLLNNKKHILKKSNRNNKKQKTTAIVGVSQKSGVTHLALSIANFVCSVLRKKVIYIELRENSSLLPVVGMKQIRLGEFVAYEYKGVIYFLTNNPDDVLKVISNEKAWIIVDMEKLNQETKTIFTNVDNKIVMGYLNPWNQNEYYEFIETCVNDLKIDVSKISFLNNSKIKKTNLVQFKRVLGCDISEVPYIEDPFSLKECNFDIYMKLVQ
ncbi:hypothetical protein SAMN02910298_02301 [Pseudobutyrivibrio sp. YE44]|uniref:hypothetical protein n=1 Tax=Pseudobutyrivibrio sp. YE44 TaxID=1520802 RepID=UPI00088BBCC1|nr:hypothetical protein [Pseudobutyrivibrio sp. YE44]SDB45743.1 hypothetical protein SAMN02910298_02301 [Pseudobutyrivibrio sp. YE44]